MVTRTHGHQAGWLSSRLARHSLLPPHTGQQACQLAHHERAAHAVWPTVSPLPSTGSCSIGDFLDSNGFEILPLKCILSKTAKQKKPAAAPAPAQAPGADAGAAQHAAAPPARLGSDHGSSQCTQDRASRVPSPVLLSSSSSGVLNCDPPVEARGAGAGAGASDAAQQAQLAALQGVAAAAAVQVQQVAWHAQGGDTQRDAALEQRGQMQRTQSKRRMQLLDLATLEVPLVAELQEIQGLPYGNATESRMQVRMQALLHRPEELPAHLQQLPLAPPHSLLLDPAPPCGLIQPQACLPLQQQQQQPSQQQHVHALNRLPGDGSEPVAAMADYLAGLSPLPPPHLLPFQEHPSVGGQPLDLRALFRAVMMHGGLISVTETGSWGKVLEVLGLRGSTQEPLQAALLKVHRTYFNLLHRFERMYDTDFWLLLTGRLVSWGKRASKEEGGETIRHRASSLALRARGAGS